MMPVGRDLGTIACFGARSNGFCITEHLSE
jgi:hypothetical protein